MLATAAIATICPGGLQLGTTLVYVSHDCYVNFIGVLEGDFLSCEIGKTYANYALQPRPADVSFT